MTEIAASPATSQAPYNERFRPQFHLSASQGWLGDPDGMIRHQGIWHVFWWGHATSPDLLHWTEQPYPMQGDDGSFVYFSGSVVVDEANTSAFGGADNPPLIAIYTMHDRESEHETQGLSISHDTTSFTFYDGNPVLDAVQPAFRDPQVFRDDAHDRWVMAIVLPKERRVQFYGSPNLRSWTLLSECGPWGARSQVWEVPDLFQVPVDGDPNNLKWVLLCGMFPNRNQYFTGDFDGTTFTLDQEANAFLVRGQGIPGLVLADFELGVPDGWQVSGQPLTPNGSGMPGGVGCMGDRYLSTFNANASEPIDVTSTPFEVSAPWINFLMAGGGNDHTSIALVVDGETVRIEHGSGDPHFRWAHWDVTELAGSTGQIRITNRYPAVAAGSLSIDHIMLSPLCIPEGSEHANWLDAGPDYYAVRICRDYDQVSNRIIAMGWMGNWEYAREVPTSWGSGYLGIPRDLSIQSWEGGLRLCQQPIPELANLRGSPVEAAAIEVIGSMSIPGFTPRANQYELDLTFDATTQAHTFGVRLAIGERGSIVVGYDRQAQTLFVDRTTPENGAFSERFARRVTTPLALVDGLRLRIFVDHASVEVFANDGEATISAAMFPNDASTGIALFANQGQACVSTLTAWELASIWHPEHAPGGDQEP